MKDITVKLDITISEAMKTLEKTAEKCLLVVDENNKLLGTLTDGDLRRTILAGEKFSEDISASYNAEPTVLIKENYSTEEAKQLLPWINQILENHGVSPSFDEMKEALGLKSKSGIHRLITGLEEREFIRRLPHRARALEVLRLPDDVSISPGQKFSPRIIQGGVKNLSII